MSLSNTVKPATAPSGKSDAVLVLETATNLVGGDRAGQHGDKHDNFMRIAHIWNGLLGAAGVTLSRPLDAHDAANMMEAMKIARRYTGKFNIDDYIDGAGYAGCAYEIRNRTP